MGVAAQLIDSAPYDDNAQILWLRALMAAGRFSQAKHSLAAFHQTMLDEFSDWTPAPELSACLRAPDNPGARWDFAIRVG